MATARHAHVAFVAVAELAVAEAQPAVLELEPGGRRHRVELGRVARSGSTTAGDGRAGLGELDELPLGELFGRIVDRDRQHDPIDRHRSHRDGRTVAWRIVGDERLDDEAAARREAVGDGGEAAGLRDPDRRG